jgi:Lar family restriction alleviation protein
MSELLSCPFCGGTPVYDHDDDGWNWIICLTCGVSTNAATHAGEDCRPMLAETWNRRATPAASPAVPQQPVATEWKMPQDQKLMQFINSTPLVMSLLYDINLLPEQIDNGRRWYYMVAVCEHMERALAALPASPAVPVQAAQAGWDHIQNLTLLGNGMASQLKKAKPECTLPARWSEYVNKHGLSSPLRAPGADPVQRPDFRMPSGSQA